MSSRSTPGVASTRATPDTAQSADDAETTIVGIDIGVKNLLAAAPASAGPDIPGALTVDGTDVRALFEDLVTTTAELQDADAEAWLAEGVVLRYYQERILDEIAGAVADLLEYLKCIGADVVVLEDLQREPLPLVECRHGNTEAGAWLLPAIQDRLESTLAREGYGTAHVDPQYTTQQCHHCQQLASVESETILCSTAGCPVDEVCRDLSAAVSIARRGREKL